MKTTMLKKAAVLAAVAAAGLTAVAAPAARPATAAEYEAARAARIAAAGGMIEKPGAAKGKIVVYDTIGGELKAEIAKTLEGLDRSIKRFQIEVVKSEASAVAAARAAATTNVAEVAVAIVSRPGAPALLGAPEDRWSEVNVAALEKGLKTPGAKAKFLPSRFRKELLRGLALACGAFGSSFPGNIMGIAKTEDLDVCEEFLPVDTWEAMRKRLKALGLAPRHAATYRSACKAGWAPAPTNAVQKAIWEKVHALPSEPIRIAPEK